MPPKIISMIVVRLIIGFSVYPHKLFSEIISIPALQKADTEVKTDIHIPSIPNSGTKTVMYNNAPANSIAKVNSITFFTNLIIPPIKFKLKESLIIILSFILIFR